MGWVGFAMGRDWQELFDMVDHQVDPYAVEFMPAKQFCMSWWWNAIDEEGNYIKESKYDLETDCIPDAKSKKWKKIDWDKAFNGNPSDKYYK